MKKILIAIFFVASVTGFVKADNNNPEAISWTNTIARPMADTLAKTYYSCKTLANTWSSQNLGAIIPNDSVLIDDGATCDKSVNANCKGDGRNPVQDGFIEGITIQCNNLITTMEANNNTNLNAILIVAVNP